MSKILTLIGEDLAKKGTRFAYLGRNGQECRGCKTENVCHNLEVGKMYEIKEVRDRSHECKVHNGKAVAVMVEKVSVEAVLPAEMAVEGSTIRYRVEECLDLSCPHYSKCHAAVPRNGGKYRIVKIKKDIKCQNGKSMKLVLLE